MTLTQVTKSGLHELALDHVFTIGASGTDHYTFQGEGLNGTVNDPTLYLTRGKTYRFENGTGAHPIRIQSTSGASGTAYNTGVTNNAGSGTVIVEVQHDAPDVLYYQCTSHANMNGILYITGALADGGVTTAKLAADAVNGTKIADNAVAAEHIAANAVGSSELADNAVDTAAIADDAVTADKIANSINTAIAANTAKNTNATHTGDVTGSGSLTIASGAVTTAKIADTAVTLAKLEHGTGSNDGKFLRANNGADPSFETVSIPAGTTINNNADNRVITGSGTANTLNGEANLTFNSSLLVSDGNGSVNVGGNYALFKRTSANTNYINAPLSDADLVVSADNNVILATNHSADFNSTERMRINSSGNVGINETSPQQQLHVHDDTAYNGILINGNGAPRIAFAKSTTTTGEWSAGIDGTNGDRFCINNSNDNSANYIILDPNSSHKVILCENTQVNGNLKFGSSGNGIDFGATANASNTGASMSSELLDDYEEGSFTPTPNTGTWTATNAKYVRIGAMCFINAHFGSVSDTTSSTAIMIPMSSLPFSKSSFTDNIYMGTCPNRYFSHSSKDTLLHWAMDGSGIHLYSSNDASGDKAYTAVEHKDIDASYSAFQIAGWYCV